MNNAIDMRVTNEANYIITHKCTIREAATALGVAKSTLHSDVHDRLKDIDTRLYYLVKTVLDYNYSVRHIRGGASTRSLYRGR